MIKFSFLKKTGSWINACVYTYIFWQCKIFYTVPRKNYLQLSNDDIFNQPIYRCTSNLPIFIQFKYKLGLIRTLVDRTFKISNKWFSFDVGIEELVKTFGRNAYPPYLIKNTVKRYLHQKYSQNENKVEDKNARQTH